MSDVKHSVTYTIMALPIFLRPLLLIGHYYRLLTRNITGWLEQSNDQLFGPLEQMIVAVVITGLAMNPGLLPEFRPQIPGPIPVPVGIPIYQPQAQALPAPPVPVPQQVEVNTTASLRNDTTPGSASTGTGHTLLDLIHSLTPNPIVISLIILLISILIHLIPAHLFRRVKDSWDIFWPPWQDRSQPSPTSSTESSSRSAPGDVPKPKEAKASAQGSDGSKAGARAGPSSSDRLTDEEKAKRKAILAYQAKKAAAAQGTDDSKPEPRSAPTADGMTDEEKSKRKAIVAYQAKKAAAAKKDEKGSVSKGPDDAKPPSTSRSASVPALGAKTVIVDPKNSDGGKSQSEKAREAKNPSAASSSDEDDKKGSSTSGDEEDPLMAGDVRPLRSILKQSKKKARQSKNVHHNYFMTMRGNRAHLVPFPHGLHPPPDQARNTLWWKNIPKNAEHIMAPPPVPKVVTDVLAGEDPTELAKKAAPVEAIVKAEPNKQGDKVKEAEKEKLKEREKAKMRAELEAREKAKALQARERSGTATASVSIEPPKQPDVPIDPQVQKAIWASQAMSCLLLFHIQEQLGLVLLAFFVWQQLNVTAARQSGETSSPQQPIATATVRAAAPPPREVPVAVKVRKEDEIPPEMKEKLARATAEKEARAASEKKKEGDDLKPASKVDKGKGKEVIPESVPSGDKVTRSKDGEKTVPRALTKEERAAYRARAAKEVSTGNTSLKSQSASTADGSMTKEKWAKMSDEEKKLYMAEREKRKHTSVKDDEPMTKDKWAKMSDEEKKVYMAERERRKNASAGVDGAMTNEKWAKMSDEVKKAYMAERERRKKAEPGKDPKTSQPPDKEEISSKKKWNELSHEDKKRNLAERETRSKPKSREEEAAAKAEKWDKMSDEDKKKYMQEKQKREQARRAALKAGEGSGLSAEEKATL